MDLLDRASWGVKKLVEKYFPSPRNYSSTMFYSCPIEEEPSSYIIDYKTQQRKMDDFCERLERLVEEMTKKV